MSEVLSVLGLVLVGYQVVKLLRWAYRRATAKRAAAPPPHVDPTVCPCASCQALRANPALRMTPEMAQIVQSMFVLASLNRAPAVVRNFDTVTQAGVGRVVLVAFNGAVYDQVVQPLLHSTFGTRAV